MRAWFPMGKHRAGVLCTNLPPRWFSESGAGLHLPYHMDRFPIAEKMFSFFPISIFLFSNICPQCKYLSHSRNIVGLYINTLCLFSTSSLYFFNVYGTSRMYSSVHRMKLVVALWLKACCSYFPSLLLYCIMTVWLCVCVPIRWIGCQEQRLWIFTSVAPGPNVGLGT